ncbi:hypothetical protein [Candidatus Palauibacter sp.]|uniref:hypothetical protein n=1 Tax=Candidatus Palauibacter sp. TaxID=3101350 RepID=UPI003B028913
MTDRNDGKPDSEVDETAARIAELVLQKLREDAARKKARRPLYGPEGVYKGLMPYMLRHIVVWILGPIGALMFIGGTIAGEAWVSASGFFWVAIALVVSRVKTRQPPLPDDDGEPGPG